jgi:hypothetical protein
VKPPGLFGLQLRRHAPFRIARAIDDSCETARQNIEYDADRRYQENGSQRDLDQVRDVDGFGREKGHPVRRTARPFARTAGRRISPYFVVAGAAAGFVFAFALCADFVLLACDFAAGAASGAAAAGAAVSAATGLAGFATSAASAAAPRPKLNRADVNRVPALFILSLQGVSVVNQYYRPQASEYWLSSAFRFK